ncbi:MAG: hypothetical protein WBI53_12300, partial [Paludibacter sp.]
QILKSSYVLSDIQLLKSTSTNPDVLHTATKSTCGCAPTMAAWESPILPRPMIAPFIISFLIKI